MNEKGRKGAENEKGERNAIFYSNSFKIPFHPLSIPSISDDVIKEGPFPVRKGRKDSGNLTRRTSLRKSRLGERRRRRESAASE